MKQGLNLPHCWYYAYGCLRPRKAPIAWYDLALQCQWQAADQFCWSGIDAVDNSVHLEIPEKI